MADDVWLTTKQAAEILGIREQTLRLRRLGRTSDSGPPWYRPLGGVRYKEAEVRAYMEARAKAPATRRLRPLPPPP